MTEISATFIPAGPAQPAGMEIDVTNAPVKPTSAYHSNFVTSTDSWTPYGAGSAIDNETAPLGHNPQQLRLVGPGDTITTAEVHCARALSGLTVGAAYHFAAYVQTLRGIMKMRVRGAADTDPEIASTAYIAAPTRTRMTLDFVAQIPNQVIEFWVRMQLAKTGQPELLMDSVFVDPATWGETLVYRTDCNGVYVPIRNPNHVDTIGVGGITLMDYEHAMVGPVTYQVIDGLGGTAECTVTVQESSSNRAPNPLGPGTTDLTPWQGQNVSMGLVGGGDAARMTVTSPTPTDLSQKIMTPISIAANVLNLGDYQPGDSFRASAQARCSMQPVSSATVTVPQVMASGIITMPSGSSSAVTLTVTPQPGDLIVYMCHVFNGANAVTGVSGLGATWTQPFPEVVGTALNTFSWWFGTNASGTGAISQNLSNGKNGQVVAFLVRGLTSFSYAKTLNTSGAATSFTSVPINAQSGQIVLNMPWFSDNSYSITYPNPASPATGWVVGPGYGVAGGVGANNWAYRIPTETTPTSHAMTATAALSGWTMQSVVIGAPGTTSSPTSRLKSRLSWYNQIGASIGPVESPAVTVNSTVYSDIVIDTVIPANAITLQWELGIEGTGTRSVGDWFEVRRVLLGRPGAWFWGDSPESEDFAYAWAGEAQDSSSLEISTAPLENVRPSLTLPLTALAATNLSPPRFSELVMVTDYNETSDSQGTVHVILGRSDKLSNPGSLLNRAGSLTLFCTHYRQAVDIKNLLRDGDVAMFRQANYLGFDLYFIARNVQVQPAEPTPTRRWLVQISYDEVPYPELPGAPPKLNTGKP